ncbi:cobalamin biosynthesis protein [Megalodesulfovibrio paquesii]
MCATGIVVRAIAPLLASKHSDPAVVVLDQDGRFAVSLLSGHLGGANALARRVAALTGGQAVITTASDCLGLPALDVLLAGRSLVPANPAALTAAMARIVRGEQLGVVDPEGWFAGAFPESVSLEAQTGMASWPGPLLVVDWRARPPWLPPGAVLVHPPALILGMGCKRGTPADALQEFVLGGQGVLARHGLARQSLAGLASAQAKADEPGMLALAQRLGLPLTCYPVEALAAVPVPTPSAVVMRRMGTPSVAEAAALLLADAAQLLVPKQTGQGMTCAVAVRSPCLLKQ